MRILFIGDVVGPHRPRGSGGGAAAAARGAAHRPGGGECRERLARLRPGPDMATALFAAGADVITLGNHAWDRKEIIPYHRRPPAAAASAEFSARHAGRRRDRGGGWRAGAGRWCCRRWGGSTWTPLDCPFRGTRRSWRGTGWAGLRAATAGGDLRRFPRRGVQREDGVRAFPRRPGVGGDRHPHALPVGGLRRCCRAARRSSRMPGCRATMTA